MRWYLIKTWAGREEALAEELKNVLPYGLYHECFTIYHERIWRKQQRSIVHTELLFPGCVFLTCEEGAEYLNIIKRNYLAAERDKYTNPAIFPLMQEDAKFLEAISGKDHLVRLSYVDKDEQGRICRLSEPLKLCQGQIKRIQYKKRFAMVHHRLWGENLVMVLGIVLKEDTEPMFLTKDVGKDVECRENDLEETGVAF